MDSVCLNPPSERAYKQEQCHRASQQQSRERNSESAPADGKNKNARVGRVVGEQWCGENEQYETENNDQEAKGDKRNEFGTRLLRHGYLRLGQIKAVERPS
jgi:hypothetical protein